MMCIGFYMGVSVEAASCMAPQLVRGGMFVRFGIEVSGVTSTTTKTICRNTSIFFKNGPKFHPLLQIEWGYCSIRSTPRKVFLGAGHGLTRAYKSIFRGG